MTAFLIALGASLALAFVRLAASAFEAAYYFVQNREYRRAWTCIVRALVFVALLATFIRPAVSFFDSFEVMSIEEAPTMPAPKPSTKLHV